MKKILNVNKLLKKINDSTIILQLSDYALEITTQIKRVNYSPVTCSKTKTFTGVKLVSKLCVYYKVCDIVNI